METENTPRKKKRSFGRMLWRVFLWGSVALALSLVVAKLLPAPLGAEDQIAIVEISGMITSSEDTVRQLMEYMEDDQIKGIVLRIDSPGGSVAPSQEIYRAVKKVKENHKKVYASLGSLAASGGYYVASTADTIIANPGTLTGSIGAIMAFSNMEDLMNKVGLHPEVVKSGPFKDTGSFSRSMSKEERALLQNVVDDVHQQFVGAVAEGRNLPFKEVAKLADGRIYTGRQALKIKLVDQLGSLEDTIELLAGDLGIVGKPAIVREKEPATLLDWLLTSKVSRSLKTAVLPPTAPGLQYLWQVR